MKKVLFIGVTNYNFKKLPPLHLKKKFLGLSKEIKPYVLARGKPFHKEMWGTDFYLFPHRILFLSCALFTGFYLCITKKIDVIVAQSPLVEGFFGSILKKVLKKELIVEVHGDWIEGPFLAKKRKFKSFQKKIVPVLAKISFRTADKIRIVANYLMRQVKEIVPNKKYFLFPTFTDLDIFLQDDNISFENIVLFVGSFFPVKGIDILINAFSKIEKDFPDFKLFLIGEGEERKNLENQVESLGLENKVIFKGKLSLQETKDIMKKCYCLALPSLSEGLPRVLLEVMALGKPVIASNIGGIPEIIQNNYNGLLFKTKNVNSLAEKLRNLLQNREIAGTMGQQGKELVKKEFSNEKYFEHYIKMINY